LQHIAGIKGDDFDHLSAALRWGSIEAKNAPPFSNTAATFHGLNAAAPLKHKRVRRIGFAHEPLRGLDAAAPLKLVRVGHVLRIVVPPRGHYAAAPLKRSRRPDQWPGQSPLVLTT
jgi:hypothetical protein